MANIINLTCGQEDRANVRSDLDLTQKKKPWEKGYGDSDEQSQKAEYRASLGDSATAIKNIEPKDIADGN
ncbi:hypothetical protein NVP1077O_29 [Vibrio phage 1.077.O._10N.261.45.A10]|nr:hypothetical protein NVP1070O_29 [Vibrio phage 1.070.O._10N.261.45.B2]AUR85607.1 hypothetical protein NVP1077O_29 [Vibrio phage 1.077.O._10N.261.45.A10]